MYFFAQGVIFISKYGQGVPTTKLGEWSDLTLAVYLYIKFKKYSSAAYTANASFNAHTLYHEMYGEAPTRKLLDNISTSLKVLEGEGVIKQIEKNYYIYSVDIASDYYVFVEADVLRTIIGEKKKNLLLFYLLLVSTFKKPDYKVGTMSAQWFAGKLGVERTTISRYMALLEELDLIYVRRQVGADGKTHIAYCRACDQNFLRKDSD